MCLCFGRALGIVGDCCVKRLCLAGIRVLGLFVWIGGVVMVVAVLVWWGN